MKALHVAKKYIVEYSDRNIYVDEDDLKWFLGEFDIEHCGDEGHYEIYRNDLRRVISEIDEWLDNDRPEDNEEATCFFDGYSDEEVDLFVNGLKIIFHDADKRGDYIFVEYF